MRSVSGQMMNTSVISVTPINSIATVTVFVSDNVSIFGNLSVSLLSTS